MKKHKFNAELCEAVLAVVSAGVRPSGHQSAAVGRDQSEQATVQGRPEQGQVQCGGHVRQHRHRPQAHLYGQVRGTAQVHRDSDQQDTLCLLVCDARVFH